MVFQKIRADKENYQFKKKMQNNQLTNNIIFYLNNILDLVYVYVVNPLTTNYYSFINE